MITARAKPRLIDPGYVMLGIRLARLSHNLIRTIMTLIASYCSPFFGGRGLHSINPDNTVFFLHLPSELLWPRVKSDLHQTLSGNLIIWIKNQNNKWVGNIYIHVLHVDTILYFFSMTKSQIIHKSQIVKYD